MRICNKCNTHEVRADYAYTCKYCHNEYSKKWAKTNPITGREWAKTRKKEIRELVIQAKNKPCADCGFEFPYYVMDLDHIAGTKKFVLSVAASKHRSLDTVSKEIAKCEAVCANCHRARTFARMNNFSVV